MDRKLLAGGNFSVSKPALFGVRGFGSSISFTRRRFFGRSRVGFVSVRKCFQKRALVGRRFFRTTWPRLEKGGSILKLVAEPCFWIILLMIPILPPGGDQPVESNSPAVPSRSAWIEHVRSPPRVVRREKSRMNDDDIDGRSRSLPSTPSSRMATHLSAELQEMLARSVIEKLSCFQEK